MKKAELLKSTSIFSGLNDKYINSLSGLMKEKRYVPGEYIFYEGDLADKLYLIAEGMVSIIKEEKRKTAGQTEETGGKMLSILKAGDFFGETALFIALPRTASAVSKTEAALWEISHTDFQKFVQSETTIAQQIYPTIIEVLMKRLENTNRELSTIYQVGKIVGRAEKLSTLAREALEQIVAAVPAAEKGYFFLWDQFSDDYNLLCQGGTDLPPDYFLPPADPLIIKLKETGEPLAVDDLRQADTLAGLEGRFYSSAQAFLTVPMFKNKKLLGFVSILSQSRSGAFSIDNRNLLSAAAEIITETIENFWHRQEAAALKRLQQTKQGSY